MEIQKYNNIILSCDIECILVGSDVWFRGKDIAIALGYKDTQHAILNNVEDEDKQNLEMINGGCEIPALTFNEQKYIIYK